MPWSAFEIQRAAVNGVGRAFVFEYRIAFCAHASRRWHVPNEKFRVSQTETQGAQAPYALSLGPAS